jgi:hypothetical protein
MAKAKQKPHDLRDEIYAPRTTETTDGRLAGDEPKSVDPLKRNPGPMTPTPGKNVPEGAATKG